ncbi:MAG TPA: class I SAM-dependent methyltransferase [Tepidiformaceae bacterium]|nr:class I SAM-dependent methyltransferase [Tepidiformaceae bacterium]
MTEPSLSSHVSYDELPYDGGCVRSSHPLRMAAMGRLFGMQAPDPRTARVLELGCGGGSNLLPMAYGLPDARFVGIDLSSRQIEIAQARAAQLQLPNIDLLALDILDTSRLHGEFDYIICHGVFSWVPDPVRDAIFATIRSRLSPQGMAFVSYNALPGWHLRRAVRDMMVYHSRYFPDLEERAVQARALVDFVNDSTGELSQVITGIEIHHQAVAATREVIARYPDYYVVHEFLEQDNQAFYLYEFVERLNAAGLQYVGDSSLAAMVSHNLPDAIAATLDRISLTNVALEQYRDFLVNRAFRHTLICRPDVQLERTIPPETAYCLFFRIAQCDPDHADPGQAQGADGRMVDIRTSEALAVVAELRTRYPSAASFEAICTATGIRNREKLAGLLLNLPAQDVVEVSVGSFPAVERSRRQMLWPPARLFASEGLPLPAPSHQVITIASVGQRIASLIDGSRTNAEILRDAVSILRASGETFQVEQQAVDASDLTRSQAETMAKRVIRSLRHHGVLSGR